MKTGRDVVVAALLGAEEYGFATAPLIVSGCVMMRVCHLDTCPVGIATQNPELRRRFTGEPEFVVTFFEYIAGTSAGEILAPRSGFRSLDEAIRARRDARHRAGNRPLEGRRTGSDANPAAAHPVPDGMPLRRYVEQDHGLDGALDNTLIQLCEGALLDGRPVRLRLPVRSSESPIGTMLGSLVTSRFGPSGLPPERSISPSAARPANPFGAFLPGGMTMRLFGDANDYVGKGLSGGRLVVHVPTSPRRSPPSATSSVAT